MTWLILDDTYIRLKKGVNPDLYRAIYRAIRRLERDL